MLATNWSFQIFDSAYLITSGGPNNSTQTVVYQIYINAFTGFNGGYASSLSVILFVIIFVITFIQQKVLDKEVSYL
jgi:multiple sugar transport system permease protein